MNNEISAEIAEFDGFDLDPTRVGYAALAESAQDFYATDGFNVVAKSDMLGVPHIITGVRFQHPSKGRGELENRRGFVTVECTVADTRTLEKEISRGRIPGVGDMIALPFDPEERLVYNDGGTGIRRQLVKMLDAFGVITVGNTDDPRRFDLAYTAWESCDQMVESGELDGEAIYVPYITRNHKGTQLVIKVQRGLYASDFSNEYGEATTYYLR